MTKVQKRESLLLLGLSRAPHADVTKAIDRAIEPFGCFQILLIIIMCLHCGIVGINITIPSFYSFTPENYTCSDEGFENTTKCVEGCKNYIFEGNETSIVTEWDLVCEKRYLVALTTTIFFVGVTFGSFICGILADKWGRLKLVLACLYLQGTLAASLYFVTSLNLFIVIRFFQGFFTQGLQTVTFTLMQEITPVRKLTLTGLIWELFWAFGLIFLGTLGYFVRDWRSLQLASTIPTLLTLTWFWLIPESPKWHLGRNNKLFALKAVKQIAKRNRANSIFDNVQGEDALFKDAEPHHRATVVDLFKNKILRKHTFVMLAVSFSVTLAYFGILLYLPNLPGGRHINFITGACFEVFAYILTFFSFSSSLGRRYSMVLIQYVTAVFCLALGVFTFIPSSQAWKNVTMITIALLGKGIAVSGTGGIYIYGAELFPTPARGSAIGLISFFARVGSLIAPQIILIGEETHEIFPMIIMTVFLFIGGTATFLVPETLHKKLPNNLMDVDEAWGKKAITVS